MTHRYSDDSRRVVLKIADDGHVIASFPANEENSDFAAVVASGEAVEPPEVPSPTAADVRAECARRLRVLTSARDDDHLGLIVSNAQREAARLHTIRLGIPGIVTGRDWTADEAARAAQLYGADAAFEAIRASSNSLETDPPADFADDAYWPPLP